MSPQEKNMRIVRSGSGKIVALRPAEVYSEDYALVEYGLSEKSSSAPFARSTKKPSVKKPQSGTEPPGAFVVELAINYARG